MRVLIVRLDHLGDVLLTTPLIRAAVKSGAEVHLLVRESCVPIFSAGTAVTTHTIESVAPGFPGDWITLARWMRAQRFHTILLPYARPRQLLLASAFSGARRRIAMWGGILGRLTLHQCLRSGMREGARHFSDIPLDCARAAGFPVDGLRPDFPLTAEEIESARGELRPRFKGLKLVGIHPGCAGNTCNLPSAVFGELAGLLLEDPAIAVIGTGISSEKTLFDAWPQAVLGHPRFFNACGRWDLRQLAAHMASFATVAIPSTGPLHVAAALGIPTVNVFCNYPPVSATVWGNLTPGTIVLNPPADFCQARRATNPDSHCDFQGKVRAVDLQRAVLEIIARRPELN
jgi:ADP-heptose:LPS heptosyltransferase